MVLKKFFSRIAERVKSAKELRAQKKQLERDFETHKIVPELRQILSDNINYLIREKNLPAATVLQNYIKLFLTFKLGFAEINEDFIKLYERNKYMDEMVDWFYESKYYCRMIGSEMSANIYIYSLPSKSLFQRKLKEFCQFLEEYRKTLQVTQFSSEIIAEILKIGFFVAWDFETLKLNGSYSRLIALLSKGFTLERISDFVWRKRLKKDITERYAIEKDEYDGVYLVKRGEHVYRNVPVTAFTVWKELSDANINVEPIVDVYNPRFRDKNYFPLYRPGDICVESRIVGEPIWHYFSSHSKHVAMKDPSVILNILRQMHNVLYELWKRGYVHTHPHMDNFTIEFVNGRPVVRLIDMAQVRKAKNIDEIKSEATRYLSSYVNHLTAVLNEKSKSAIKEKFIKFVNASLERLRLAN